MSEPSGDSINVVLLDADEQFRALMAHHITAAWPDAEIESLGSLGEMDESVRPHCFVLDHLTLQRAANSTDAALWFRAAAAIASSPCIVVADPSDELLAVRYMKGGARDFLPKRLIKHDLFVASISDCLEYFSSPDLAESAPPPPARPPKPRKPRKKRAKTTGRKAGNGRRKPDNASDPLPGLIAEMEAEAGGHPDPQPAEPSAPAFVADGEDSEAGAGAEPEARVAPEPASDGAAGPAEASTPQAVPGPDDAAEPASEEAAPGDAVAADLAEPPVPEAAEAAAADAAERTDPEIPAKVNGSRRSAAVALRGGGGPVINGYRIIRPIAKGGIASVCLAHSEPLGHDVALKVLRISKSNAANKLYERFEQEYRLVSTIDSPSVVKTYDFGRTKREVYIALEYFPCGDLRSRMLEPVNVEQAIDYVQKIATALQELHALDILHRDLKPANVMLREDDSIALIDFGMAKQLQSTENLTLPGTVQGTPYYLSPEQAKGRVVDERSDIYSLGVMLFEMLEGRKPYAQKNALDVCMAHITEPVPRLSGNNEGFQPLLDRMMAKELDERFPNMDELLDSLPEVA